MKKLSRRESEIIELLCLGYEYSEIAEELSISKKTVPTYVERILYKMCANNRLAAVANYVKLQYKN